MRQFGQSQAVDQFQQKLHFQYAPQGQKPEKDRFKADRYEDFGGKNALSQADLMASQMSDLSSYRPGEFKRKYEKELHLMIDDLEMPNDDMTISSLSQSPWQGKSTRSFLSNLTSARGPNGTNTNTDEIALTAGSGMISRQDLQNFNGSVGSSQEFEYGSAERRHNATTFKSQDEGKGSPAFARELISVTDDLTVSNTDEENKSSYRGTGVGLINVHD